MNKKIFFLIALLLLAAAGVYMALARKTYRLTVKVPLVMTRALPYIQNPSLAARWYLPFAGADSSAIRITTDSLKKISLNDDYVELSPEGPVAVRFSSVRNNQKKEFIFQIIPDTVQPNHSELSMTYQSNLLNKWFNLNKHQSDVIKSFSHLTAWLENSEKVFGYKIETIAVTDTAFLFLKKTVPPEQFQAGANELFTNLIKFAGEKNAGYNGVRIFHFIKSPGGEMELFAGIGVNNYTETKPDDPVQYKKMPAGKNLLVAWFEGPYREVARAYQALEEYKKDNGLVSMAIPFQKFISDGFAFADTQVVKIRVTYPVY